MATISYAGFPFLEFRFRISWNEERQRIKLCIPTVLRSGNVLCEVPGGVILRPTNGQEHVHGRWMILSGLVAGRETALAVVNSGQNGFDVSDGEIRLTLVRSPLYCHERTFPETEIRLRKHHDQGVHDVRLLLLAGNTSDVRTAVTGLADWLSAPPYALAHYPRGAETGPVESLMTIEQGTVRLLACKQSWDGEAVIMRLQEIEGRTSRAVIRMHEPSGVMELPFRPLEIKTVRCEKRGEWREVALIEEE
jgi:alpha-mannosidase